jgi:hypothetical protein
MAAAHDRSMNAELIEGATDGAIRKRHPDRGGIVEPTADVVRSESGQVMVDDHPMVNKSGTVRGC